jgi:hypothetical protein
MASRFPSCCVAPNDAALCEAATRQAIFWDGNLGGVSAALGGHEHDLNKTEVRTVLRTTFAHVSAQSCRHATQISWSPSCVSYLKFLSIRRIHQ